MESPSLASLPEEGLEATKIKNNKSRDIKKAKRHLSPPLSLLFLVAFLLSISRIYSRNRRTCSFLSTRRWLAWTMCDDVLTVLKASYGDSPPAILLVGHSRGGSVAVHVAAKKALPNLAGLFVVDVVEGTAIASLVHMQKILLGRMRLFSSTEKAIERSVKGGSVRNIDSARLSVPATLKYDDSKKWYEGLSEKFLSSPIAKLLLLAGTDRLDRTLTICTNARQVPNGGSEKHWTWIQEDAPDEFATLMVNFISRNHIGPHGNEIPGLCRSSPSQ